MSIPHTTHTTHILSISQHPNTQGVFLAEWDGLNQDNRSTEIVVNEASNVRIHENNSALTAKEKNDRFMAQAPVVVLGATNRPTDLDAAFLRRMPVQIQTHMPDLTARVKIFRAQLLRDAIADDVDLAELAAATHNFSGSDIRELIRVAKQQRAKQVMHSAKAALAMVTDASEKNNNNNNNNKNNNSSSGSPVGKAISKEHFMFALSKSVSSGECMYYIVSTCVCTLLACSWALCSVTSKLQFTKHSHHISKLDFSPT